MNGDADNLTQKQLARKIIEVRYPRADNKLLAEYFEMYGATRASVESLLDELLGALDRPWPWPGYELPAPLRANVEFFKVVSRRAVERFRASGMVSAREVSGFFLHNHMIFKYGIQRWLAANAGIAFELFTIETETVEANFLAGLRERGVKLGDQVIHLHVISNNERGDLEQLGFPVPYKHWDKQYYVEALALVDGLLQSNPRSIGLFCEHSWVFDPALHRVASDGKSLVSFDFLGDDELVGERFFVGLALPDNAYFKQYEFALRSPRRLKLHRQGEFTPKTYGIFYAKDRLREYLGRR